MITTGVCPNGHPSNLEGGGWGFKSQLSGGGGDWDMDDFISWVGFDFHALHGGKDKSLKVSVRVGSTKNKNTEGGGWWAPGPHLGNTINKPPRLILRFTLSIRALFSERNKRLIYYMNNRLYCLRNEWTDFFFRLWKYLDIKCYRYWNIFHLLIISSDHF